MEESSKNKKTNYKKWSFGILVCIIILKVIALSMIINYSEGFDNAENFMQKINIISLVGLALLLAGIALTILSMVKKEEQNYQYYASVIGYPILFLFYFMF